VANLSTEMMKMARSSRFRRRFIALSAILEHPLQTYTKDRLKNILTDQAISENLLPMLAFSEPLRSVDLIDRAWAVMEQFVVLEPNEEEFIAGIGRGEVLSKLLFKAGSENEKKINEHPAILWKVVNVRNQLAKLSKRKKAGPFRTV
jgi:hypothetical protein